MQVRGVRVGAERGRQRCCDHWSRTERGWGGAETRRAGPHNGRGPASGREESGSRLGQGKGQGDSGR